MPPPMRRVPLGHLHEREKLDSVGPLTPFSVETVFEPPSDPRRTSSRGGRPCDVPPEGAPSSDNGSGDKEEEEAAVADA